MTDKDKKTHSDEVEKTITSLDDLDSIEVGPYFFARIKARTESSDNSVPRTLIPSVITKLAPAYLVLIVLINVFTGVMVLWGGTKSVDSLAEENLSTMESEYLSPGAPDFLDIISE